MKKILGWICFPFFILAFGSVLLSNHVLQVLFFRLGGQKGHEKAIDVLQFGLLGSLLTVFSRISVIGKVPKYSRDQPMIIISNHQSMFDIAIIGWVFRRHHPRFISKDTLAKGIPAVSYNLRHGGSVAINRKDRKTAMKAIADFGVYLENMGRACCIFAEGTRSRDGKVLPFKLGGMSQLLKTCPSAVIVPVAVENSWKFSRYKHLPVPVGTHLKLSILEVIDKEGKDVRQIVEEAEKKVRVCLGQEL